MIHKTESGFTLLEVLFAVALLAMGLLGLGLMQGHFAEGNARSRQITRATDIVADKIEELSNADASDGDLNIGNHGPVTITEYSLDYDLSWTVTEDDTETGEDILVIDIEVDWTTGGQPHNITFQWARST
ncbi:MAG: prepilin-type N-terminal cleavage/methylation domain-containing protein [Desulfobacteraceae bacterium]|nr:prepilin-type N-terminal cleavage/methylation domain-containing protein [Desulfobacteraceae bacterium]